MGAVFFLIFLAILFFISLSFIILSTIFIIRWNIKKRKGTPPKKRWLIIPVIILVINVIIALIPIGYIGFLRYANSSNKHDIVNIQSDKVLYWPMTDNQSTTSWFDMDGERYIRFSNQSSKHSFSIDYNDEQLEEPIATIKYNVSDSNPFNNFMWVLLSGSTYSEQNQAVVYPVKSSREFGFHYVKNSPGSATKAGGTFCLEDQLDSINAYYTDISNYNTQNLVYKYNKVTPSKEQSGKQDDMIYTIIEEEVILDSGTFETIFGLLVEGKTPPRIDVPEKYEQRELLAYSNDKIASKHVYLVLVAGQVYAMETSGSGYITGYITGYPLSDDMNQYIIHNLFSP